MRVSVVVPTYKRPDLLSRCLDALLAQTFDQAEFEILVTDDGASSDTRDMVELLAWQTNRRPVVRYIQVHGTSGPAAARNAGWRAAFGDIIAFTDDDCIPDPAWLKAGVAAFQDGVAGVSGKLVMPIPEEPTDYQLNAAQLSKAEFVTANCFYRRDVLEESGGFDERFKAAWREDSDLQFRLLESGYRLVSCADAVVMHPVRRADWGVSISQQRKSMYNALLFKEHPELYREKIQTSSPWRYYGIVAALVSTAAGAVTSHNRMAAGSALVWTLLTGAFCARRLTGTSRSPGHIAEMVVTSAVIPPLSVFWRILGAVKFRVRFF